MPTRWPRRKAERKTSCSLRCGPFTRIWPSTPGTARWKAAQTTTRSTPSRGSTTWSPASTCACEQGGATSPRLRFHLGDVLPAERLMFHRRLPDHVRASLSIDRLPLEEPSVFAVGFDGLDMA